MNNLTLMMLQVDVYVAAGTCVLACCVLIHSETEIRTGRKERKACISGAMIVAGRGGEHGRPACPANGAGAEEQTTRRPRDKAACCAEQSKSAGARARARARMSEETDTRRPVLSAAPPPPPPPPAVLYVLCTSY
jgi:hypothetical protein